MQLGVATSPMTIGAPCNANLSTVEGYETIPLMKRKWMIIEMH